MSEIYMLVSISIACTGFSSEGGISSCHISYAYAFERLGVHVPIFYHVPRNSLARKIFNYILNQCFFLALVFLKMNES